MWIKLFNVKIQVTEINEAFNLLCFISIIPIKNHKLNNLS